MQKVVTHSGSFHADDVFAVATLQLLYGVENIEVIRTRDEEIIKNGDIVLDVGGEYSPENNRFDHHQNGAPVREGDVPFAAFGLIWKHFGVQLCEDKELAEIIERQLVLAIDANDNGVSVFSLNDLGISPTTVQDLIGSFKPVWGSEEDFDSGFILACNFARDVLNRFIAQARGQILEKNYVAKIYSESADKTFLVFDKPVTSTLLIEYPEVMAITYATEEGKWNVALVRKNFDSFETKVRFPEIWAGLRDGELEKVSGISGAVFCHKARFLFVASDREGALEAINKTLL